MLSVKVNKMELYRIGDSLTCLFNGVRFNTKILKKSSEAISIFIPLTFKGFPEDKREFPRIPVELEGRINSNMEENVYHTKPIVDTAITDLSLKGFGFYSSKKLICGPHPYYLYVQTNYGLIKAEVIVKYEKSLVDKFQYGCEIQSMIKKDQHLLMRFYLIKQLEQPSVMG